MLIKDNFKITCTMEHDRLIKKYRGLLDNSFKNFGKNKFNSGNIIAIN